MIKLLILCLFVAVFAAMDFRPPRNMFDGYSTFARESGQFSHKIVLRALTWEDAQKYCQAEGASLTGFDSYEEAEFVFKMTLKVPTTIGFFIGGKRRDNCYSFTSNPSDRCGRPNIFQWVNNVASNPITDKMWTVGIWGEGDRKENPDTSGECLSLRGTNITWMDMSKGGYLDDMHCKSHLWFICGKQVF